MKTKELAKLVDSKKVYNLNNMEVAGIAYDSRKIKENFVFVALKGSYPTDTSL